MKREYVIIGTGLAGLIAAYELSSICDEKSTILVIEKRDKVGGNSKKATSGINILLTPIQAKNNVEDSYSDFLNDSLRSGQHKNDTSLISTTIIDSHYLWYFFEEMGLNLSSLCILGGHSKARTHKPSPKINKAIGEYLISNLYEILKKKVNVQFLFKATVCELFAENEQITGLEYYFEEEPDIKYKIKTNVIILATGGFAHDFSEKDSLLKEFAKDKMNFPTTNGNQTQGIGIKIARKIGVALTQMENVQLHPTGFVDIEDRLNKHKILAPELLRGLGGILLNKKTERFCNELGTRDYISNMIIAYCDRVYTKQIEQYEAYLILSQNIINNLPNSEFYLNKHLIYKIEDFKFWKYDKEKLNKIIKDNNWNNQQIYIAIVTPCLHYCMGGVKINKNGECISAKSGKVFRGLYAAGEVAGGIHGANRLGGNSLTDCAVFGRRTAKYAKQYIDLNF